MFTHSSDDREGLKHKEKDQRICKIVASAIDKHWLILNRISRVELYYLCENFIARDEYNQRRRSDEETADKLISFAKSECVDENDKEQLSQSSITKNNLKSLKPLNKNKMISVYSIAKSLLLHTKHSDGGIVLQMSPNNIRYNTYHPSSICSKILLSLFARQTKYYNTFIMKEIKGDKQIYDKYILGKKCDNVIDGFKGIDDIEKYKEIARELLFEQSNIPSIHRVENEEIQITGAKLIEFLQQEPEIINPTNGDRYTVIAHYLTNRNGNILDTFHYNSRYLVYLNPLRKKRVLDKNGKIVNINLTEIKPLNADNFGKLHQFLSGSFILSGHFEEIYSHLKKNLTINPKLIVYHTLMELKKYDFQTFDKTQHANCIKTALNTYEALLVATQQNFKNINSDIVEICNKQVQVYEEYIKKINNYTLDDFETDFQQEEKQIKKEISNIQQSQRRITKTASKEQHTRSSLFKKIFDFFTFKTCCNASTVVDAEQNIEKINSNDIHNIDNDANNSSSKRNLDNIERSAVCC